MVDLVEMLDHALLDISAALAKRTGDVLNQVLSVSVGEHLSEELTGLLVVVVGVRQGVATDFTGDGEFGLGVALVLNRAVEVVGLVVADGALVSVDGGGTVSDVVGDAGSVGAVDGDLLVVGADTVSVGISVVQESTLEHSVERGLNTWDHMGRGKGNLLSLSVEVLGVTVQSELSNGDKRVVGMRPHLGHVVDIISVVISLSNRHNLDEPRP